MRFIPNGPSLPDELLIARDAGEVLFFCGAGVSMAEANLPNFTRLTERVMESLGSAQKSPARQLFDAARKFEEESRLTGLVPTDRIFGLLEREFEPREVREAVAMALKPKPDCGLGAHRTLLDLSRTPAGVPRLVTTNFDLLFEACEPRIASSNPPRLPDPNRVADFQGIIHLHGRVDAEYLGARDDEFVLSSADFGHAYLSDGWATRYILALLKRFRIVFVGYSADDPPVQYLLEALNRFDKGDHALYAFQSGNTTQAISQWKHKGVTPIDYDSANDHAALWETLSAWAERARDVQGWHEKLLTKAANGPSRMTPHERGMVAHLAATTSGAQRLATAKHPLPADWLRVFDRNDRYAPPRRINIYDKLSPIFDPFDAFGLDSDVPPAPPNLNTSYPKRLVPEGVWDGMEATSTDLKNLVIDAAAQLRGHRADVAPDLPPRLYSLGVWIAKIADQPTTLWWAAQQAKLHPQIQSAIDFSLRNEREKVRYSPDVRDGWRMLHLCWQQRIPDPRLPQYVVEEKAKREGWSPALVREAIALYRPIITANRPLQVRKSPMPDPALAVKDIVSFSVEYPRLDNPLDIPSNLLGYAVALFREQLEYAVQLEREIYGRDNIYLSDTRPDDGSTLSENDSGGLTGHLIAFIQMMTRLAAADNDAARRETARWTLIENDVFYRMRIWSAGRKDLTSPAEAGQIFLGLDTETFWSRNHEREILFALRDRWAEMPPSNITELESRLCQVSTPPPDAGEDWDAINASHQLSWLYWLTTNGVIFSDECQSKIARLRAGSPKWTENSAKYTAERRDLKVHTIKTDTNSSALEKSPIGNILEVAHSLSQTDFDSHVQRQPFRGLAKSRPARALSAITNAARKGKFVSQPWSDLLGSNCEKANSSRMLLIIGHRLAALTPSDLAEIAHPVSKWLLDRNEQLFSKHPQVFDLVWDSMITALTGTNDLNRSPHADRNWIDEGDNRPAGRMAGALLNHPVLANLESNRGLPENWKRWVTQLLGLPHDQPRYAVAMIARNLNSLFDIDPDWAKARLLPRAGDKGDDGKAFWAGYFSGQLTPQHSLYQLLKPHFIVLAGQKNLRSEHTNILAGILLLGWGSEEKSSDSEQLIQDIELREILIDAGDDLRVQMLWDLERRLFQQGTMWGNRLLPFLERVWPRQLSARTARTSDRLVDMALAIPDRFPEIVQSILPRLVPFMGGSLRTNKLLSDADGSIFKNHPKDLLALFYAILPEDRIAWPYETNKILTRLSEQSETRDDPRLADLLRREQRR
jgi:hypothetical protein